MKKVEDWVAKYNYFDFTDREGIIGVSHELFRDIIEKCIELEERLEQLELNKPPMAEDRLKKLIKKSKIEEKLIKAIEIPTKPAHKPPVIKTKVYKPRKKKTNQTESRKIKK